MRAGETVLWLLEISAFYDEGALIEVEAEVVIPD